MSNPQMLTGLCWYGVLADSLVGLTYAVHSTLELGQVRLDMSWFLSHQETKHTKVDPKQAKPHYKAYEIHKLVVERPVYLELWHAVVAQEPPNFPLTLIFFNSVWTVSRMLIDSFFILFILPLLDGRVVRRQWESQPRPAT
jgi:hypothetical protein